MDSLKLENVINNPYLLSIYDQVANQTIMPWSYFLPVFGILYLLFCRALRYRRRDSLLKKYNYPTRESLAKMTNDEAQVIGKALGQLEFPYIYTTSLQFALFKTYAIPTISKLLADTRQFTTRENASKRYADTVVIIDEFVGNPPVSDRCIRSLARLNYIHGQYPQILNSDYLYTLAQFIVSPVTFINAYEWRTLTPLEICAIATLWKGIGDGMNISYHELRRAKEGWKDGIEFYEDVKEWAEDYEKRVMVPAESNHKTGVETVALLLCLVPGVMHPFAKNLLSVLMGERVRIAMMFPPPPQIFHTIAATIFSTRSFLLRHLSLPRPYFLRTATLADAPNPLTNRYNYNSYQALPYYIEPTFYNRWIAPQAWATWAMGGAVPGDRRGDEDYEKDGYVIEDVGPKKMRGRGLEKMEVFEKKLRSERVSGCPFGVRKV